MDKIPISFRLNGEPVSVEISANYTLLDMLRLKLGVLSPKKGCDSGDCGACTVLLNGLPVCSCLLLAPQVDGMDVTTVEGLAREGRLHPVQEGFVKGFGLQCGFCTPGFIMTAVALLQGNKNPTEEEIKYAFEGNICRCTGYSQIIKSVQLAASAMNSI